MLRRTQILLQTEEKTGDYIQENDTLKRKLFIDKKSKNSLSPSKRSTNSSHVIKITSLSSKSQPDNQNTNKSLIKIRSISKVAPKTSFFSKIDTFSSIFKQSCYEFNIPQSLAVL